MCDKPEAFCRKRVHRIFFVIVVFFLASCNDTDLGNGKDVNPNAVYFDYKIWAEEGREEAGCLIQYRFGGEDGTSFVLHDPSQVTLDGKLLAVDSSAVTGTYYEAIRPLASFAGRHVITFTDSKKKEYREEFEFTPFRLAKELPQQLPKQPFSIQLEDYPAGPGIRLVMTDTAFTSGDFNRIVPVKNGAIQVNTAMLNGLQEGPLSVELFREEEWPVKAGTKKGGKVTISYGLKRETELVKP